MRYIHLRKVISAFAMLFTAFYFTAACAAKERTYAQDGQSELNSVSCIGSKDVLYLHGMDSLIPSSQEIQNRKILKAISEKYNIRIALPRASQPCAQSPNQICWGWSFDKTELSFVANTIKAASTSCKLPPKNILIGFSNGAYALNKLLRQCLTSQDQVIIARSQYF